MSLALAWTKTDDARLDARRAHILPWVSSGIWAATRGRSSCTCSCSMSAVSCVVNGIWRCTFNRLRELFLNLQWELGGLAAIFCVRLARVLVVVIQGSSCARLVANWTASTYVLRLAVDSAAWLCQCSVWLARRGLGLRVWRCGLACCHLIVDGMLLTCRGGRRLGRVFGDTVDLLVTMSVKDVLDLLHCARSTLVLVKWYDKQTHTTKAQLLVCQDIIAEMFVHSLTPMIS